MQVRVLFFGMLKEVAGRDAEIVSLPEDASLSDLLAHYRKTIPKLERFLPSLALSVNQEFSAPNAQLHDKDEVALLPPVSGGASERVQLVRQRIDTEAVIREMTHPASGALVIFDGTVRDNSHGRRTLYLDYEAYEPMAAKQLQMLVDEARVRFAIQDARIVHRIGRLEIGETSVLIVVASAHRGDAFDACRWLIDALKKTVPIWKKEYFADGAVWADGEPFPAEIAGGGEVACR